MKRENEILMQNIITCTCLNFSYTAQAISFPLVRTTTHGQSVYPDIALHISNYYINIELLMLNVLKGN